MTSPVDLKFCGEVVVTLSVIMDPLGSVPLFLGLTGGRSARARARLAWQSVLTAAVVISVFAVFGQSILEYLGIGIPALQGAGGLLLGLVALELLTDRGDEPAATPDVSVALVPLGTPLLAGPGAIVATLVFVRRAEGYQQILAIALGLVAVHMLLWLALRFSVVIIRVVKESGIVLLTRILGLLLSAIAVQLVAESVTAFVAQAKAHSGG